MVPVVRTRAVVHDGQVIVVLVRIFMFPVPVLAQFLARRVNVVALRSQLMARI